MMTNKKILGINCQTWLTAILASFRNRYSAFNQAIKTNKGYQTVDFSLAQYQFLSFSINL